MLVYVIPASPALQALQSGVMAFIRQYVSNRPSPAMAA
jgi:hypothetical protein